MKKLLSEMSRDEVERLCDRLSNVIGKRLPGDSEFVLLVFPADSPNPARDTLICSSVCHLEVPELLRDVAKMADRNIAEVN